MREYILRRIASMVPVLLLVSMISFGLLYVLPGDPAIAILGENAGSTATYQALRQELGLDRPLWQQYAGWLGHVARGDLGTSIRSQEPVTTVLLRRMPISLYVGAAGLLVGILIGFPIAILSALRPGSKFDLIGTAWHSVASRSPASGRRSSSSTSSRSSCAGCRPAATPPR